MFQNRYFKIKMSDNASFSYEMEHGEKIEIGFPKFEIDGNIIEQQQAFRFVEKEELTKDISEITLESNSSQEVTVELVLRVSMESPMIRFKYRIGATKTCQLTKVSGVDNLEYLSYKTVKEAKRTEVRFADYNHLYHCHILKEVEAFQDEKEVMGPILTETCGDTSILAAYEHGSQYPDKFIAFFKEKDIISVKAIKGNYYSGQQINEENKYETIWLQLGGINGDKEQLANVYRTFQLKYCTLNSESRKPYIFYNTWAFQERNKFYNKKQYLSSMCEERINEEIEIAHRMGIDVFVIDTGWYKKTGDWEINMNKFPNGLGKIKETLDRYGMKLGLWFNPIVAAKTSEMYLENTDAVVKKRNEESQGLPIWETEESYEMCLSSVYWKKYAEKLCVLKEKLGVNYFKWDAVGMYGCNMGNHEHGLESNDEKECELCYAFNLVRNLTKIMDYVCKKHSDVIFDFDVTEGERCMGLAFLSSGKYFAINNGPYYENFDIEISKNQWSNVFVTPGPARTWICRKMLNYDKWIPSVLFLTHYLPDEGRRSQRINLASLILGQNGIWGDLLEVSEEGIELFAKVLDDYKKVRTPITESSPIVTGEPGESFETREKINNGQGVVVLFGNHRGCYTYRVRNSTDKKITIYGNASVKNYDNNIYIIADFHEPDAVIVFFGV